MYRTHTCGELRIQDVNKNVTLAGWVHTIRTHGALTFLDLRDRYGITQIVVKKEDADNITKESVIQIKGRVMKKPEANKTLATGEIEVKADTVVLLSKAKALPLSLDTSETTEETRLKYRYLDLRTRHMQNNLLMRHKVSMIIRTFFDALGFLEIETPILGKSTPEGARDYLVPSRIQKGMFYALPQSPQIFKQLFQVAGLDKYIQIAKCFRDEDLRADRQPEFTQIDIEMSFVEEEDIYDIIENMMVTIWKKTINKDIPRPFQQITYEEAMRKYGSDKPDLRFGLEIEDITPWAKQSDINFLKEKDCVRALKVKASFSRKQIEDLTKSVSVFGAKGLAYLKREKESYTGSLAKIIKTPPLKLSDGETAFIIAGTKQVVALSLGELRLRLGNDLHLIDTSIWKFVWVTHFPLMEWSEKDNRWTAMHHPFTSPKEEDRYLLKTAPEKASSRAYDLTLNGVELGGGSIRIHERKLQEEVFDALKINRQEQEEKFGFMLNAFEYGAPPHGGIAFGLDRLIMLLTGANNIREVIAFPKNKDAKDIMMNSPSNVSPQQLDELGILTKKK